MEVAADEAFAAVRKLSKVKKPKERKTKTRGKNQDKKGKKSRESKLISEELDKIVSDLENVRLKKTEAVEKEDYDAAEKLKKDELSLKDRGDSLEAELKEALKSE